MPQDMDLHVAIFESGKIFCGYPYAEGTLLHNAAQILLSQMAKKKSCDTLAEKKIARWEEKRSAVIAEMIARGDKLSMEDTAFLKKQEETLIKIHIVNLAHPFFSYGPKGRIVQTISLAGALTYYSVKDLDPVVSDKIVETYALFLEAASKPLEVTPSVEEGKKKSNLVALNKR